MTFTEPMPFDAAVARLESKTPIAAALSSEQWSQLRLGLRDRAFFSAQVDSLKTVATMQQKLSDALRMTSDKKTAFTDRSKFVADMREFLGAAPGDSRELTDITSTNRLGLIYDFQIEEAREFGRWQAGQDEAILDEFPAQELIRLWEPQGGPQARRDWAQRWIDAGGISRGGRMIAPKDSPIWTHPALSRFGHPYPPFDYNSGMGLEDVARDEAEDLGVIPRGAKVQPQERDYNQALQASVPDASPVLLEGFKNIFGDQVDVSGGKITWQGQRIAKLYERALNDPSLKWNMDLGEITPAAVASAQKAGVDLTGARLQFTADEIRHIDKAHGPAAELQGDQRAVTALDLQLVPHVWRTPDTVKPGLKPGTLEFSADVAGQRTLVVFDRAAKTPKWGVKTLYIKKGTP